MANEVKPSYEELEKKVTALELLIKQQETQFNEQRKVLATRMQEMYEALNYRRLDFLFKVLEYPEKFSSDFVVTCTEEIENTMTIPESTEDNKKEG